MKRKSKRISKKAVGTKTRLRLPDLDQAKAAVLNSLASPESKRGYPHAIDEFIGWYCSEPRLSFNKTVVTRYRIHLETRQLAPGTINVRLAAVRRLAYEAADSGLLSPELAAGIRHVKGAKKLGVRLGNWLTAEEYQTWKLSLFSFYSPSDQDALVIPEVWHAFTDRLSAAAGANIFAGQHQTTFLGQFDRNDNLYIVLRFDF